MEKRLIKQNNQTYLGELSGYLIFASTFGYLGLSTSFGFLNMKVATGCFILPGMLLSGATFYGRHH